MIGAKVTILPHRTASDSFGGTRGVVLREEGADFIVDIGYTEVAIPRSRFDVDEMPPDTERTTRECSDCGEDRDYCECDEMEAELMGLRFDNGYDSDME